MLEDETLEAEFRVPIRNNTGEHVKLTGVTRINYACADAEHMVAISDDGTRIFLRAVDALKAHADSFDKVICKYRLSKADAKTIEDALEGRWLPPVESGNGVWMRCRNKSIVRFQESDEISKRLDENKMTPFPGRPGLMLGPSTMFSTFQELHNGKGSMGFDPRQREARTQAQSDLYLTPHNHEHPFALLFIYSGIHQKGLDEVDVHQYEVVHNDSNKLVIHLTFRGQSSPRLLHIYEFDKPRGFVIRKFERRDIDSNKVVGTTVVDYIETPDKKLFPSKISNVFGGRTADGGYSYTIKQYKLEDLQVGNCPDDDEFQLKLPAGTMIYHLRDDGPAIRTRRDEVIRADDIELVLARLEERQKNPLSDTAIVAPSFWSRNLWPLVGAGLGVLLLAAALLRRRRKALA